MKEFSLDAISSRFNKLQLLSENSINANDTMRKEMEFHYILPHNIVEFFFSKNDHFHIESNKQKFSGPNLNICNPLLVFLSFYPKYN